MSTIQPGYEDALKLAEQAGEWLSVLQEGNEHREAFFQWLAASPRNVQEMLEVLAVAHAIGALSTDVCERLTQLTAERGADLVGAQNVTRLPRPSSREALALTATSSASTDAPRRRAIWRRPFAIAAAIVLCLFVGLLTQIGRVAFYSTGVGEQRVVELADGSVAHLNTDSFLIVRFTGRERRVYLREGQALFKVQPEASRPFLVDTDAAVIRAIGTQFDVYRRASHTRVTVLEGTVQVSTDKHRDDAPAGSRVLSAVQLGAGEGAEVLRGTVTREAMDVVKVTSWRQRRLIFRQDTLAEIAEEFNRYNSSQRIHVIGESASRETFSGTFDIDAPDTLIRALSAEPSLHVERAGKDIVIRPRDR